MKLDIYHEDSAFELLRDEWNALLNRSVVNEIFLTWEWQATWWRAYAPGDLWLIVGRDENGALAGIAPWFREMPSRVIRPIGCVDVTDYLDIIAPPEQHEAFLSALAEWLAEQRGEYERVNLCNMQDRSPTKAVLPPLLEAHGFKVELQQQETCPRIALPATFEDYLNSLDKKQRHELRRKMRRAEEAENAGGEKVDWYIVGPEHDLNEQTELFITLMKASHPDKAKFMDEPQNAAFFRAMVPQVAACGWLQLAFLTVDGNAAAAYLNFDYDNRIGVYNSGLLLGSYGHLSSGIVLLCYLIKHNIEQRRTMFDFLRGNEDYKYRMGAQDSPVMEMRIYP